MDSDQKLTLRTTRKVHSKKNVSKKLKCSSSGSSSESDTNTIKCKNKKSHVQPKKTIPSIKHQHKRMRNKSSSSDSSSSEDTSTSSSGTSVSSSTSEEERKRIKKRRHKLKKHKIKQHIATSISPNVKEGIDEGPSNDIPLELMGGNSMAPITKEEWEKKQSVVRHVYDESTGRHRLIKGDGEVIEEIVSKDRHKQINQQATKGDGDYFQKHLNKL